MPRMAEEESADETDEGREPEGRPEEVELAIKAVLGPSAASGSQAFPVLATDGGRWHVKAPNNPQGSRVLVTEYLMSRVGQLIGAPVCEVSPIAITEEFADFQVVNGPKLAKGIASASRDVADVTEMRGALEYRDKDDNARRHAGVVAFYDWCWGDDPQWLVVTTRDNELHSHDHGFYLPPGGQDWSVATLEANVGEAHPLGTPSEGLDVAELERLAEALRAVTTEQIAGVVGSVPAAWPVTDDELTSVSSYLCQRAPEVAQRVDQLRARLESP